MTIYCETREFNETLKSAIISILEGIVSRYEVPGLAAGVWRGSSSYCLIAYGHSDVQSKRNITFHDHFRIASVTKTFVSTAILILCEKGGLNLEAPASACLPVLKTLPSIRIIELLNHTSGLFDYFEDAMFQKRLLEIPLEPRQPQELLQIGISRPRYFEPGEGYRYSNTNYIALGMIIEKVYGGPLEKALDELIIRPLNLANTCLPRSDPKLPEPFARGYALSAYGDSLIDLTFLNPDFAWAAGGMVSNLLDMGRWSLELARGSLLDDHSKKMRIQSVDASSGGIPYMRYGLGLSIMGNFIGHEGEILGYNTALYGNPLLDIGIAVLINRSYGNPSVAGETFAYLARAVDPEGFPA